MNDTPQTRLVRHSIVRTLAQAGALLWLAVPGMARATSLQLSFTAPTSLNESNRQAVLEWNAEPARTYLVQSADDLAPGTEWKTEDAVNSVSNLPVRWMAPESLTTKRFYRLVLPQPEVFSVEPGFIDSGDPNASLYLFGQCLPTNALVEINGLYFNATNADPNGTSLRVISLNGLPPGEPILGKIRVLNPANSNVITEWSVQSPLVYGTEMTTEQLQGPPEEPPASPTRKEFKGHVTLLKAFDDDDGDALSARGHTKSGHVTLLKAFDDEDGDAFSARGHTKSGHVTLLKRGGDTGSGRMAGPLEGGKKEFKGHVTLLKREMSPGGGGDDDCDGPEVFPATGEVRCQETDLAIPGVGLDFAWTRTYRSRTGPTTPQGAGWDFSYNVTLTPQPDGTVVLRTGDGRQNTFYPSGTNGWFRDEYFVTVADSDDDGSADLVLFPDTGKWLFRPPGTAAAGKLSQIVERNGNTITLDYDGAGRLTTIVDSLNRTNLVAYNGAGQIESVTDSSGRTVRYEYDSNGDLVACVSPAVVGTPTGNDFPGGRTNRYTYSSGNLDDRLNHNLTSCIDPKGQTWLELVYFTTNNPASRDFDAVATTLRGIEKKDIRRGMVIAKPGSIAPQLQVIENDYLGNVTECFYDSRFRPVEVREFTGRANPTLPTTATDNRPTGKLRADDPDYFETQYEWNADSLCTRMIYPDSSSTELVFQSAYNQNSARSNKTRQHDADLRVIRESPCCDQDDDGDGVPDTLVTTFEYDDRYGSPGTSRGKKLYVGNLPFADSGPAGITGRGTVATGRIETGVAAGLDGDNPPIIKGSALAASATIKIRHKGWDGLIYGNHRIRPRGWDGTIKGSTKWDDQDCDGFVTEMTDPRGQVTTAEYDTHGNCTRSIKQGHYAVSNFHIEVDGLYSSQGQLTAVTNAPDANGYRQVDTFTYYVSGPQAGFLQSETRDATGLALTTSYEYDSRANITRMVDARGNDQLFTYNDLDECVRAQTPTNLTARGTTDFIYDANGNIVQSSAELRDENDNFVRTVASLAEYDFLDRCTAVAEQVLPGVFVTNRFFYDGNSQLTAIQSPLAVSGLDPQNTVAFEYDERGLLFREIGAPGSGNSPTNEYDYTLNGQRERINQLESKLNNLGLLTYDGYGRPTSYTDPMSNVVSYTYDRNGNLTQVRLYGETNDVPGNAGNRLLAETRYTYDSLDRCVQQVDSFFDIFTLKPIGDGEATTTLAYAPNGDCTSVTDDNDHTTLFAFDTAGRLASITDPKTNVVSYSYDECDNVIGITQTDRSDLSGSSQQFTVIRAFNKLHRLMRSMDNAGNTNSYFYDSLGRVVRVTDPKGNVSWAVYDDLGRLSRSIGDLDGDGVPDLGADANTSWSYDDNSRCVATTDANTNTTVYGYDSLDRCVAITAADGTACSLVWSPRSNLLRQQNANGTVVSNSFDLLDRCVARSITPGPTVAATTTFETFAYNSLSACVAASNDVSFVTFDYDSLGNCVRSTQDGWSTTSTFDGTGNCTAMTYPSGRIVTGTYNELGELASLSSSAGGGLPPVTLATYDYEGPGRVGRISQGNNINTRIQWNGLVNPPNAPGDFGWQQVSGVNHQVAGGGTVIDRRVLTYDRNQNKTRRAQASAFFTGGPRRTNDFAHDALDRLATSATAYLGIATNRTYVLDGNGNRQLIFENGLAQPYFMEATIPPADFQMNQYTVTPFGPQTYDDNGNLIMRVSSGIQLQFVYDYADRLVAVNDLTSGLLEPLATYAYDALGRRIGKTSFPPAPQLPVATQFVHDGSDCDDEDAIEERENGTLRRTHVAPHVFEQKGRISAGRTFAVPHVFDQKGRVMFTDAGATLYFHDDDLGNTLALTDAAGNVVERYDYDDFGQPMFLSVDGFPLATNRSAVGNAFLFHGMEWDAETGLYRYDYDNRNTWRAGGGSYVDPQTGSDINARLNINNGMPNRISMNVTVPKQTQGATFGEKVNAGLQAAGSALASGAGQRAKIVEKATSGLKDTLKTQVIMAPGGGGGGGGFLLKKEEGGRHTPFQNGYGNSGSGGGSALAKPRDPWKTYWERHYHKTGHVTLLK